MKIDYYPHKGDFFVSLGHTYEQIKFIQAVPDKEDPSILNGVSMEDIVLGKERGFLVQPIGDITGPYFPIFFGNDDNVRKELQAYRKLVNTVRRIVDDFIDGKPRYAVDIHELEQYLVGQKISISEIQAVLKSLLGNAGLYKYSRSGRKGYFKFSDDKIKAHNKLKYYSSIAEELSVKSEKISLLVAHGPTVGNYREAILRDLIRHHLPGKFGIGTGFIQGFANQLDIIIYDAINYAPSFKEGELIVVKQEAVRAVIEVKTTLTSTTLFEALAMFHRISLPAYKSSVLPIFKGVYSFDSSYRSTKAVANFIYDFYNKPYFEEQVQKKFTRDVLYLFHQVSCVATLNKYCVLSKYHKSDSGKTIPKLYSISDKKGLDVQTAVFMSLLFEYLDVEPYAKRSAVWQLSNLLGFSSVIKHERNLTDDDWIPRSRSHYEHEYDENSIAKRVQSFEDWFSGESSTDNLVNEITGRLNGDMSKQSE